MYTHTTVNRVTENGEPRIALGTRDFLTTDLAIAEGLGYD